MLAKVLLTKRDPENARRENRSRIELDLAAQFFAKAVQQDPRDAKTYYLIAQARFKARDFRNASLAITQAIKLNPTQPQFHALSEEIQRAQTGESQR